MSDDEMLDMDGEDGGTIQFGEQQRFDPETGMPIANEEMEITEGDSTAGATSSYMASMPATIDSRKETWMLSIAEKNSSNTTDLKVPHMLGIDEAGRGPVLGSMVYGVCWCPIEKLEELKKIKVADSKTLTFAQRDQLFRTIQSTPWLGYEVDVISADRLSREMLRRNRINLNAISHDSAIMLIQKTLDHGVNLREIYVDTVGDAGKYQDKLTSIFPGISITVSKKADSLFPVVSAASIAAKVTRDLNLDQWSFPEERAQPNGIVISPTEYPLRCSRKLGSGYPGDPMTKIWLQNHLDPIFGYPSLVRFSWGTTKKILKTEAVQVEWGDEEEEDEDEEGEDGSNQKLGKFFSAKDAPAGTTTPAKSKSEPAALTSPPLIQVNPNNKKFAPLHDSLTHKQYTIPQKERIGWFQQHQMQIATTF